MQFEESQKARKYGVAVGYALSYVIFTSILYGILSFSKKLPVSWSLVHIIAITASIALIGAIFKRLLK